MRRLCRYRGDAPVLTPVGDIAKRVRADDPKSSARMAFTKARVLLQADLLEDLFGYDVLVDHDIHCLVLHEGAREIVETVIGRAFAP